MSCKGGKVPGAECLSCVDASCLKGQSMFVVVFANTSLCAPCTPHGGKL